MNVKHVILLGALCASVLFTVAWGKAADPNASSQAKETAADFSVSGANAAVVVSPSTRLVVALTHVSGNGFRVFRQSVANAGQLNPDLYVGDVSDTCTAIVVEVTAPDRIWVKSSGSTPAVGKVSVLSY